MAKFLYCLVTHFRLNQSYRLNNSGKFTAGEKFIAAEIHPNLSHPGNRATMPIAAVRSFQNPSLLN